MLPALLLILQQATAAPTFTRDVAPLLWRRCAVCHRPGGAAPFPLTSYGEAGKRARTIARVTGSRYMPPWLPVPGHGEFRGDRRLADDDIETLRRWADAGAPEGEGEPPPLPRWSTGWQLGEPDLVVGLPEPYPLPAAGSDRFRNFVIPVPLETTRFVAAVELRPRGTRAVHHAILRLDRTRSSRELDAAEPGPGFAGMTMGRSEPPDGHFIGWTPGRAPRRSPAGLAWRLHESADLVLQLHLTPTGKPENVDVEIGFHFTERPPTRHPYSVVLYSEAIDIPPGAEAHHVRDRYTLPCDVDVLTVYPHAHYLAKRMIARARRPDGSFEPLLRIDDWDFDWQDEYVYRTPLRLPAGTVLEFDYSFDNSTDNVRNPHQPPRRVRFGQRSSDEMATLTLQVIPVRAEDLRALRLARWRHALTKDASDWEAHTRIAGLLTAAGSIGEAMGHLETALRLHPENGNAWSNLGIALVRQRRVEEAEQCYRRALELGGADHVANNNLGELLLGRRRFEGAIRRFEAALDGRPEYFAARVNLANALAMRGQPELALPHFRRALRSRPDSSEGHNNLANTLFTLDRLAEAIDHYRKALAIAPSYFNARFNLGRALLANGERAAAILELERAVTLRPNFEPVRTALARARQKR